MIGNNNTYFAEQQINRNNFKDYDFVCKKTQLDLFETIRKINRNFDSYDLQR